MMHDHEPLLNIKLAVVGLMRWRWTNNVCLFDARVKQTRKGQKSLQKIDVDDVVGSLRHRCTLYGTSGGVLFLFHKQRFFY